jgi:hypothetical protein
VGAVIAATHDYFKSIDALKAVPSAVLAVVLWPLILLGIQPPRALATAPGFGIFEA